MSKYIWIKNRKYYYYKAYDTWKEAYDTAKYYRKKNKKNRYFIQKVERGFLFPEIKYRLYMSHIMKVW